MQVAVHCTIGRLKPKAKVLAAVPDGLCHPYEYVIYLLGLTPCVLNGRALHGIRSKVNSSQVKVKVKLFTNRCIEKSLPLRPSKSCTTLMGGPHTIPVRVRTTVREGRGKLRQSNMSVPSATSHKLPHVS